MGKLLADIVGEPPEVSYPPYDRLSNVLAFLSIFFLRCCPVLIPRVQDTYAVLTGRSDMSHFATTDILSYFI